MIPNQNGINHSNPQSAIWGLENGEELNYIITNYDQKSDKFRELKSKYCVKDFPNLEIKGVIWLINKFFRYKTTNITRKNYNQQLRDLDKPRPGQILSSLRRDNCNQTSN